MGLFSRDPIAYAKLYSNCFTSDHVPGHKTTISFGMVKAIATEISGPFKAEEDLVAIKLWEEAKKLGANAVINFRFDSGTYQNNGLYSIQGYIITYGDAVIIEKEQ